MLLGGGEGSVRMRLVHVLVTLIMELGQSKWRPMATGTAAGQ